MCERFTLGDVYLARMDTGADWRAEIETLAREENVEVGWFNAIGAIQDAEIQFYDQTTEEDRPILFEEPLG